MNDVQRNDARSDANVSNAFANRTSSELFQTFYHQLCYLAAARLRRERANHILTPAALVHEAWLRLGGESQGFQDVGHFLAVARLTMRRVLVDYARSQNAQRRGYGETPTAIQALAGLRDTQQDERIPQLKAAIACLEKFSPRAARVVEMRFFAGFTEKEAAHALRVTRRTVNRDWEMARAWFSERLCAKPATASAELHIHENASSGSIEPRSPRPAFPFVAPRASAEPLRRAWSPQMRPGTKIA